MVANLRGDGERLVVHTRNNPSVPDDVDLEAVTRSGMGLVDFTQSWEIPEESDSSAQQVSFSTLRKLSSRGGYGVIHTEGFETVVVGRITPPAFMFVELGEGEEAKRFKAFQMSEFAEIEREDFTDAYRAVENRAFFPTMQTIGAGDENPGKEAITEAFVELDLAGELERF